MTVLLEATNLSKHFGQASEDVRQILISAEKVEKRAGRIREVEFDEADEGAAPDPVVIGTAARHLPAAE